MSKENHGEIMSTEKNSFFVYQSSQAILPADTSGSKLEEWAKGMLNLVCKVFLFILARDFYMP
jgi:hypothetical protein